VQDAIGEKMNKTERKDFNWLLKHELLKPIELPAFTPEEKKEFIEKIQRLRSAARKRLEKTERR